MSAVEGVVFDLGGVVIDWNPRHLYRKVFAEEASMERFLAEVCTGAWNGQQDAGRTLAEATAERVAAFPAFEAEIRAYYGRWREMVAGRVPGTADVMRRLHGAGYKLYALSNWSAETFPLVEDEFEEFALFDEILLSGHFGLAKPDRRFFDAALARVPIAPGKLVFTDDNAANAAAGAQVGMKGIAFRDAERDLRALGVRV